jgi:hypothetical protein
MLGLRAAGGNWRTLRKYAATWSISTDHFDPNAGRRGVPQVSRPLSSVLVEGSSFSRWHLKNRLFQEGFKERRCEICGQDELWRGRRMALILDHINGIADDHRLENLRIVCPNCAATLETHCGKLNKRVYEARDCPQCGKTFQPKHGKQRYCCRACGQRYIRGVPMPERRKVARPPYTHLVREVAAIGYRATGRRYGVSDTAIRKWLLWYEREQERQSEPAPEPEAAVRVGPPE